MLKRLQHRSSDANNKAPPTIYQRLLHRGRRKKHQVRRKGRKLLQRGIRNQLVGPSERPRQKNGMKTEQNESETERDGMEVQIDNSATEAGMEAWEELGVPLAIIKALRELGFMLPTEIQRQAIPVAMDTDRDVIGAAETGSGKTLAFSIPILSYIIRNDTRRSVGNTIATTSHKETPVVAMETKTQRFIDLNMVLHSEGEEDDDQLDDAVGGASRESGNEFESESLVGDNEGAGGVGLVDSLDDIPEEEFLKMIGGDVIGGSHDLDDVTNQSEVVTKSDSIRELSNFDDELGSHDLNDVTKSSHDLDDVTKRSHDHKLLALILTPTRELALQVKSHICDAAKYTGIKVCVLVGGMADEKQERLLNQHPPIVVATPGRLWKLMSEGHPHLTNLDAVRYLVLDEADRMIEFGHYQELSSILERLNEATGVGGRGGRENGLGRTGERKRQTFVFSATLTLPRRSAERKVKVRWRKNLSGPESIANLISQVGLRDDPVIVDLSRHGGTAETLSEMKILCSAEEKDVYLYYFLLLYAGRTLVFVNSISTLQKLRSLLELLGLLPLPLHARMQQRQRLRNFDRFTASPDGLLLASDVAARGLDFPSVQHVIHYHVPCNSELYVHRSGRTARTKKEGLSVILIGPEDMTSYRNICRTLNKDDIPTFPMDTMYLSTIRKRVSVAKKIETELHRKKKTRRHTDWVRSSAQALELELDQDWYGIEVKPTSINRKEAEKVDSLKAELKSLLREPIIPRSMSTAYPTRDENHHLLNGLRGTSWDISWRKSNQIITTDTRDALLTAKTHTSKQKH